MFRHTNLEAALRLGLDAPDMTHRAMAENLQLEEAVSDKRRVLFEKELMSKGVSTWEDLRQGQMDYVRQYVKTNLTQPHTFMDALEPAGFTPENPAEFLVRLEILSVPLKEHGWSFKDLNDARVGNHTPGLNSFCNTWNSLRDHRPAFSTLLSSVADAVESPGWAEILRDQLGLAHFDGAHVPLPVALCKFSVKDVCREWTNSPPWQTSTPITKPTVLDSDLWEHYFPAPRTVPHGQAMALTPCTDAAAIKLELLNARVTYRPENIWKVGQIVTRAPLSDITSLRRSHREALEHAHGGFGV
ncbi:hypothetical protein [Rhodobacter sp. KR11]|uniref:hypothetical protein n=1 Tax=Rhodobacter sp. KR11 TaxID=2974588 RepID=UPI002223CDE1|nr:hypothetical protein [Rhodobacter sp. KR11]